MAYIIEKCSTCGRAVSVNVAQIFWDGEVTINSNYFCSNCGNLTEINWDGKVLEDKIAKAITEKDGIWSLVIISPDKDRVMIIKSLKSELKLEKDKIKYILKNFDNLKLNGTHEEIEKMAYVFSREGVSVYIERIK